MTDSPRLGEGSGGQSAEASAKADRESRTIDRESLPWTMIRLITMSVDARFHPKRIVIDDRGNELLVVKALA